MGNWIALRVACVIVDCRLSDTVSAEINENLLSEPNWFQTDLHIILLKLIIADGFQLFYGS